MASYTVKRSKHATLVAYTADTVTLTSRPTSVELRSFSTTAVILYRVDGTAATVMATTHTGSVLRRRFKLIFQGDVEPAQLV
jgi:hypothetical protein